MTRRNGRNEDGSRKYIRVENGIQNQIPTTERGWRRAARRNAAKNEKSRRA